MVGNSERAAVPLIDPLLIGLTVYRAGVVALLHSTKGQHCVMLIVRTMLSSPGQQTICIHIIHRLCYTALKFKRGAQTRFLASKRQRTDFPLTCVPSSLPIPRRSTAQRTVPCIEAPTVLSM